MGIFIGRSGDSYTNSHILLIKNDGPESRFAGMPNEVYLPFQFDAGVTYNFTLSIVNDTCVITVSNGAQTVTINVPLGGYSVLMDQVFMYDEQSGYDGLRFDDFLVTSTARPVSIDIRPGTFPNQVNLNSNGVIPVAILSDATFDALQVDPSTILLAGGSVKLIGKGDRYACSQQDVNADGRLDLVCNVQVNQLQLTVGDSTAVLEAKTFSGQVMQGYDSVQVRQ